MTLAVEGQPDRAAIVAHAARTIARGSQSFALASKLFGKSVRERAWLLYAWCRACDDMVDGQELGHGMNAPADPMARLAIAQAHTEQALSAEKVDDPVFQGLGMVSRECGIPRQFIMDHLLGFAADASGWRPQTEADLLGYCYQVAGAVGCMMAVVMGVDPANADTLDRACDLGIAFQLGNIARDVREDAENGRCYLPAEWLATHGLDERNMMAAENRQALADVVARLVTMASRYEASARVGAARLPFRCRWAVLAATRVYGGIAREVGRKGASAWDARVVLPTPVKLLAAACALPDCARPATPVSRAGLWVRPLA